ncbi:hypothetical protein LAX5112_04221 [Roseibium alexandrii]|uniref:Uncharacterized protein n=1 Tax=Roseibium alexandrii TaxID=388408 RepID=A0A0M7AP71_9HYPH|nr:hypothetical protein LAX5112_04221 [Roseibium alexandrii]
MELGAAVLCRYRTVEMRLSLLSQDNLNNLIQVSDF